MQRESGLVYTRMLILLVQFVDLHKISVTVDQGYQGERGMGQHVADSESGTQ